MVLVVVVRVWKRVYLHAHTDRYVGGGVWRCFCYVMKTVKGVEKIVKIDM
jgi:hypothetical protein